MRSWMEAGLCWGAAVVFTAVALPFVAVAALLLRTVLLVVAVVAGLGAAVAYCASPRFRAWLLRHPGVVDAATNGVD